MTLFASRYLSPGTLQCPSSHTLIVKGSHVSERTTEMQMTLKPVDLLLKRDTRLAKHVHQVSTVWADEPITNATQSTEFCRITHRFEVDDLTAMRASERISLFDDL